MLGFSAVSVCLCCVVAILSLSLHDISVSQTFVVSHHQTPPLPMLQDAVPWVGTRMKLRPLVGMTGKERKKIDKATSNEKPELASYRYEVHTGTPRVQTSAKTGRQVDTLPMVASIHP